jgi:glucose uptake protein
MAWGSWLAPSQNIPFKNQQIKIFYVSISNLVMAFLVGLFQGLHHITLTNFWLPFLGGVIWGISGYFAFLGTSSIGIARSIGIISPMNMVVSIVWGVILFGEFTHSSISTIILAIASVIIIITGIIIIVNAKKTTGDAGNNEVLKKARKTGLMGIMVAGILWGSFFIPVRISDMSTWVAAFPMAVGIFTSSAVMALCAGKSFSLEKKSYYPRVFLSGILWGIGNYACLKTMELLGTGKGFTIIQLNLAVNTLIGIFVFKEVQLKSKAAFLVFFGITLSLAGVILLGNLK